MKYKNKKVLVLGEGVSGRSAASFLQERGAIVTIYDDIETVEGITHKDEAQNSEQKSAGKPHSSIVRFLSGKKEINAAEYDFCVISPGVCIRHKVAKLFEGRIISELALGFSARHKKVIAVTGTNGKTTTVSMLAKVLKGSVLCGNIGVPVTSVERQIRKRKAVVEVSSFMMEAPGNFRPNIACILNISQDHLERHKTMKKYIECKAAIAKNMKKKDILILNYDDENCLEISKKVNCRTYFFSTSAAVKGIYLKDKNVVLNVCGKPKTIFNINKFCEEKPHSVQNLLAVILIAKLAKMKSASILAACKSYRSAEHRISYVGVKDNIMFYNDSKATNIAACIAACRCFHLPINLLLGGQAKGQNFAELFDLLPNNVEQIFCFGESADLIMKAAGDFINIIQCKNMQEATLRAMQVGEGPRVVLLSPACASFDAFNGYADRGKQFMEYVQGLIAENKT